MLFGPRINGARRWFGIAGIGVQPSEFAKIAIIFFVAAILERRMDRIDDLRYSLVPVAIVLGGVVGLIMLQPDLGTALSIIVDRHRRWSSPPGSTIATSSACCWCRCRPRTSC